MTNEELLNGENTNIEYKRELPDKSIKYVKTAVAKINFGAKIEGLFREDAYEIPEQAIRETLVNAVVHRSYLYPSYIQLALFDDRLEITSPGGLPPGLTVERMKEGLSIVRNEALANAFRYMNLFEHFGSGIPRVIGQMKEYGLREPEYVDLKVGVRVNFYRTEHINRSYGEFDGLCFSDGAVVYGDDGVGANVGVNKSQLTKRQVVMLDLISRFPELSAVEMSEKMSVSSRTVERDLACLQNMGLIEHVGSAKKGKWIRK